MNHNRIMEFVGTYMIEGLFVLFIIGCIILGIIYTDEKPLSKKSFTVILHDNGTNTVKLDVQGYIQISSRGVSMVNPNTKFRQIFTNELVIIQP